MPTRKVSVVMSSAALSSQGTIPTPEQVCAAAKAVGYALGDQDYALVGGAACVLLGSTRATEDVDIVVPKGNTPAARSLLKQQIKYFDVANKTLHTTYKSTPLVEIEIIAPPALFKEAFDASTPIIIVEGAKVLKPVLILNAKCRSILGRAEEKKKRCDATDIQFLLSWCARNHAYPTSEEVPNASKQFVSWFIQRYGGKDYWTNAQYDLEIGLFLLSLVQSPPC